jgi:endogenous inhibitor of DNA gyrase (YacG/DUF329 family)
MTFAAKFYFACPFCGETVHSGDTILVVENSDQAERQIKQLYKECPECGQSLEGRRLEITVYPR